MLHSPTRPIVQTPQSAPDRDGNLRFSGVETHPDGYKFNWATADSALLYNDAPRYAPLYLTLRLNLQRPANVAPAAIEIFERPAQPSETDALVEGSERKIGELRFNSDAPGPQDYALTLPPREHGKGVYLTFKSNTFQAPGDRRALAFLFLGAKLEMKPSHLRYLVWPHFYFPAILLLLAAAVAWGWLVGLNWLVNAIFNAQLAYALMMAAQSTWRVSWLVLLLAFALWGCFFWAYRTNWLQKPGWRGLLPLFAACAIVVGLFLATNDELKGDTLYYVNWSRSIHDYGVWDIYAQEKSLNYLPLVVYLLWIYNLFAYPLGWADSILFWRVFASVLFLALLVVLYGLARVRPVAKEDAPSPGYPLPTTLLLIGFNVSLFYNPTVWGQSDIISMLPVALSFYLIYRQKPYLSGLMLGLTLISKPQAWFVLPIAVLLLFKICGWRRGTLALLPGLALALIGSLVAFGFNGGSLVRYWSQGQLSGETNYAFPAAYNLSYLFVEMGDEYPRWLTLLGFGLTGLVFAGVLWFTLRGATALPHTTLGAALLNTACFTFLIKMKERYLIYAMPLLGLGLHYNRALLPPFLLLSWLQLLNLSSIMFMSGRSRLQTMPEFFYLWTSLLGEVWLRKTVAVLFILTLVYMAGLYLLPLLKVRQPKSDKSG